MVGALLVGALAASAVLLLGRSLRLSPFQALVAEAPAELRTAVERLADNGLRMRMLAALKLGSADVGFPRLEWWDYTHQGLDAELTVLGGQSTSDWTDEDTLDALAHFLHVPKVTAYSPDPARIRLQVRIFDALAPVATLPEGVPDVVDLEAVRVGVREDGGWWLLRVLYAHVLLAGATGAGKGSVLWSILAGLGPAMRSGLVDVWMADPKGGMEFGRGQRLFVRFQWDVDGILGMLAEAVTVMQERAASLRESGVRKHVPTPDAPLILIVIDEAAALSAYATREQEAEFERLVGLLLSQGRAVGVSVVAALQDPSKETMPARQLFPVRIGLRLTESSQIAMVHGPGAKDRGARCHEIPESTPGVGYVGEDGSNTFVRVRAFWLDTDDIDALVDAYAPQQPDLSPVQDYSGFDPDDLGDGEGAAA